MTPQRTLTLRAGTFQRISRATHEGSVRAVHVSSCPVTRWSVLSNKDDDKLGGRSFGTDEKVMVCVTETKPGKSL